MFSAERIFTFTQAISRDALLGQLATSLYEAGLVKASFKEGVLQREAQYPTGIYMETHSIAIPHTEFEHVNHTGFAVGINQAGVQFHRTDEPGELVTPDIIVMMAIAPDCEKVAIIQSLFGLLADKERVQALCKMSVTEQVKEFTDAVVTR